ncbi:MAG: PIN domain-containing protein [Pseudolabrys sp.]|nr:PIN domain-containing protein [Pseudolabrys sp.]MDP2298339.1 PIN domain-containing protein [Pseudolabrys sp.]
MTDAVQDQLVYLDANVFIHAVEGTPETAAGPVKLLDFLRRNPGLAATSEITFAESLATPQRQDALPLQIKRRAYLDLLLWSAFIRLVPVSRDVLIETADLRAVARLKLPDAVHLVSAIRARCRYFVSSDKDFHKLPSGMTFVTPDVLSIDGLLKALA